MTLSRNGRMSAIPCGPPKEIRRTASKIPPPTAYCLLLTAYCPLSGSSMLFTEPIFLFAFLPILLGLYFYRREHSAYANWLLVIASIIFYLKGGGAFTWL